MKPATHRLPTPLNNYQQKISHKQVDAVRRELPFSSCTHEPRHNDKVARTDVKKTSGNKTANSQHQHLDRRKATRRPSGRPLLAAPGARAHACAHMGIWDTAHARAALSAHAQTGRGCTALQSSDRRDALQRSPAAPRCLQDACLVQGACAHLSKKAMTHADKPRRPQTGRGARSLPRPILKWTSV